MSHPKRPRLRSEQARVRRQEAVDFARGNVRLEGFVLSPEVEAIFARYIRGEITHEETTRLVKEAAGVPPA
jgi:hypothetical protein